MKSALNMPAVILGLAVAATSARGGPQRTDAASIIAKCAEAMGGAARIKAVREIRIEIVYPDHGSAPVITEIRLPNRIRSERPGSFISGFDGKTPMLLMYDPAKPGQPPVPQDLPPEAARGFEIDLVWFFPLFFEYPAEYAGIVESKGTTCHRIIASLPLGSKAEYRIDARTSLVRSIAAEETFQGQTFHMEREWLDLVPVQGILYPRRMTYPGRNGAQATAEINSVEFR